MSDESKLTGTYQNATLDSKLTITEAIDSGPQAGTIKGTFTLGDGSFDISGHWNRIAAPVVLAFSSTVNQQNKIVGAAGSVVGSTTQIDQINLGYTIAAEGGDVVSSMGLYQRIDN